MLWSVKAGGMDRPSRTKLRPTGSLSSSHAGGRSGWASPLAFGLIGVLCKRRGFLISLSQRGLKRIKVNLDSLFISAEHRGHSIHCHTYIVTFLYLNSPPPPSIFFICLLFIFYIFSYNKLIHTSIRRRSTLVSSLLFAR